MKLKVLYLNLEGEEKSVLCRSILRTGNSTLVLLDEENKIIMRLQINFLFGITIDNSKQVLG